MAIERISDLSPNEVYTLEEACRFLKVSAPTARRWIKAGRLRARKIGRDYRLFGSDLLNALATPDRLSKLKLLTPDHPLLELVGVGDSGRSDIAEEHDRYLAEFLRNTGDHPTLAPRTSSVRGHLGVVRALGSPRPLARPRE